MTLKWSQPKWRGCQALGSSRIGNNGERITWFQFTFVVSANVATVRRYQQHRTVTKTTASESLCEAVTLPCWCFPRRGRKARPAVSKPLPPQSCSRPLVSQNVNASPCVTPLRFFSVGNGEPICACVWSCSRFFWYDGVSSKDGTLAEYCRRKIVLPRTFIGAVAVPEGSMDTVVAEVAAVAIELTTPISCLWATTKQTAEGILISVGQKM